MANINPFLSKPDQWAQELKEIQEQRKKLDKREVHLKSKLEMYARENGLKNDVEEIVRYFSQNRSK